MEERRRSPRGPVDKEQLAALPFVVNVQVLDISAAGVLLESSRPVDISTRGNLRLNVGGVPLAAEVEVRRVSQVPAGSAGGSYRIGAMFTAITAEHWQVIERFAKR